MSLSHQQYADLSNDAYEYRPPSEEPYNINGIEYRVLEHVDNNRNGYQGTIYQRVDTGEIVVAHRGTEFDQGIKAALQDGGLADGGMVLARINAQAPDAIELTRRAIRYAEKNEKGYFPPPEVSVAGHSLGGCLAQITAHYFKLKGETFDAYGAVSLNRKIPEGGDLVINHVMAGDPVSAASKHFGQVRIYTTLEEVKNLASVGGYENNQSQFDVRSPSSAVLASLGSHSMHHFLNVNGEGKPDRSILADPRALELAAQFAPMIEKYRNDIATARSGVTLGARGPMGVVIDGIDHFRGPLPPGMPAIHEAQATIAWETALSWEELNGVASSRRPLAPQVDTKPPSSPGSFQPEYPLSLPDYLSPGSAPRVPLKPGQSLPGNPQAVIPSHHPDHALYAEQKQRLPPETSEDRLAQITLAAKMGGVKAGQVDSLHVAENPLRMIVSGKIPGDRAQVNLTAPPPSMHETLERSETYDQRRMQQVAQWQAQDQQLNQSHGMGGRAL